MGEVHRLNTLGLRDAKIAVLGLGHVGLPTALGLADLGWQVIGADQAVEKVALLRSGKSPFYEPGLQELLSKHLASGKFILSDDVDSAVKSALVVFVCVGTPQKDSGVADMSQVEAVARTIARNLNGYKLIVEKSTVPAATAERIKKTIELYAHVDTPLAKRNGSRGRRRPGAQPLAGNINVDVASNPEFLQEGKAVQGFFHPDRIVLGVESGRARLILEEIYRPLKCPILVTNLCTAELIKHAANAFLATKISFINMLSDLCEGVGADVTKVAQGLGLDPRIGPGFLSAGIGFGGYCLPKDLRALARLAEEHRVVCSLLLEVEHINESRITRFLDKVRNALWVVEGKTIGVLGLAFKPGTDDIREAPSVKIIEALLREGASLRLYDPQAIPHMRPVFPEQPGRLAYYSSAYEAARGAHALLVVTEWEEFRQLDLSRIRDLMEVPIIVDGRNIYDPWKVFEAGLDYFCMGRENIDRALAALAKQRTLTARRSGQSGRIPKSFAATASRPA